MADNYISLKNINKIYQNNVHAVHDFNLNIQKEEFIVFVGPSGCGKSTTLRMIAGLEDISSGELYIDGLLANGMSPKDRDIAMVFQSYALYPHMSVYNNLAFGLKMRKISEEIKDENGNNIFEIDTKRIKTIEKEIKTIKKDILTCDKSIKKYESNKTSDAQEFIAKVEEIMETLEGELLKKEKELEFYQNNKVKKTKLRKYAKKEIDERIRTAASILEIENYLNSKPRELSGGQRQRVALGRAIVRKAKVFLMDEPLSNLDAKLRVTMRSEIIALHQKIGATTIYVTHDQTEAMTMADRIVVMKDGYIQQIGTPKEIYNKPNNVFVATFIGSPAMNILSASINEDELKIDDNLTFKMPREILEARKEFYSQKIKETQTEINKLNIKIHEQEEIISCSKNTFKKKKAKNAISKFEEELKSSNDRLNSYQKYFNNQNKDILVGIRPEEIKMDKTSSYTIKVEICELLGNEYYIHSKIGENKIVIKVTTKDVISHNDEINIKFELSDLHIFDPVSNEVIR